MKEGSLIPERKIFLNPIQVKYMTLFENLARVPVKDVIIDDEENRLIFLVEKNCIGQVLGRRGRRLRAIREALWMELKKEVEVVEYDDNPKNFLRNLFKPARVEEVVIRSTGGLKVAYIYVLREDKGIAIGRNGRKIKRARIVAKRWLGIDNVKIGDAERLTS